MAHGRDWREPVEEPSDAIDVEPDRWPGKGSRTAGPSPGGPLPDPGKRAPSHRLQLDPESSFDGWYQQAVVAADKLEQAIASRDVEAALGAASALTRLIPLVRRGATSKRRASIKAIDERATSLLARAPKLGERAYRERFQSPKGAPRPTWEAESRAWKGGDDAIARDGVDGPATQLPYLDRLQASFGHHDLSKVRAHTDAAAVDSARELGARAYAFGDDVAFGKAPDLHTAAHEAAHVVQQRAGVALAGGTADDVYERHADAVADVVVRGGSAETMLDSFAGRGATASPAVQRAPETGPGPAPVVSTKGLPGPIVLDLVGDRFEVDLQKIDGALWLRIQYLDDKPFTVGDTNEVTRLAKLKLEPLYLHKATADWSRPFDTVVIGRSATTLTYDLYNDGSAVLEVVGGTKRYSDIDTRTHVITPQINRVTASSDISILHVHLPPAVAATSGAARTKNATAERAVTVPLSLAGDTVPLTARRFGDTDEIMLQLGSGTPTTVEMLVPITNVGLRVLHDDGQNISIDLNNDGQIDATLIHTMRELDKPPPDIGGVRQQ
ncbi:MAG TPA: DUF4157 domain-containing protein, partial [Kofleriaceae bacterium]|nr:DUF4157 domain-containing protein [Kofleriaceae bacterium]